MFTYFPVWDISYLVATTFTLGSIVWVLNGFFVFLPFSPGVEFPGQVLYGGGITAFIGATIFEVGSFFIMLEAVNENRTGCFGWAVERLGEGDDSEAGTVTQAVPSKETCSHHHQNTSNVVGQPSLESRLTNPIKGDPTPEGNNSWVWWPSSNELRTHYMHDVGFLACLVQSIGATVFWISGFTALPGIFNNMSKPLLDGLYWTPQVIGATGFVISGMMFMLETQRRWYLPALGTLGWHVGFWNFLGGVGFLLCPCFGYSETHWAQYQACLTSFWGKLLRRHCGRAPADCWLFFSGSWSFLTGSVLQWYESLEKHPVEVEKEHQA